MSIPDPARSVLHLAWPLVLSFWMRQLFTFVDTLFAARIGDEAVAGIGLAYPYEFLLIAFWVGASTGMTSLLARAMAAHEGERIDQVIATTRRLVLLLVPLFLTLGAAIWISPATFVAKNVPDEVLANFRIYASVIIGGTALTGFWAILPDSIVKAHHDTKATMWAGIASNLLNVGLNFLFVFGFGWGMFGIALSTVLGRFAGLAYALMQAARHEARRRGERADNVPGLDPHPWRAILALALPASATYILMATESATINAILARTPRPTESLAAYSISYRTLMFFMMPLIACGVALLPFTARQWGRRDVSAIRRAFRDIALAGSAYTVLIVMPITLLFADALVAPFASSLATRELAAFAIRTVPFACLAALPFLACRPVFEGMQSGGPGVVMAVLRHLVLMAPFAWIGGRLAGSMGRPELHGVLLGIITATVITSVVFLSWMVRRLNHAERTLAATT